MSIEQNIRTFKDFLQFYNVMSQMCFSHCVNTFQRRDLEDDEASCVEKCANKLIRFNNRSIVVYAELQQQLMEKRISEMEKESAALAASQATALPNTEIAGDISLKEQTPSSELENESKLA